MCGIAACWVDKPATEYLLSALSRLEYRGYDSAGIAVRAGDGILRVRAAGRLAGLRRSLEVRGSRDIGGLGIGHTRWATHGAANEANAHPHVDCHAAVHVVHNGIIENAAVLRSELILAGHVFATEVDTEVIAHLVEDARADGAELFAAVQKAVARLTGSWAIAVLDARSNEMVLSAYRSPLLVADNGAGVLAASDLAALAGWATSARPLEHGDCVVVSPHGTRWLRADGSTQPPASIPVDDVAEVRLGDAPDHMAKEIGEQPLRCALLVDRLRDGIPDGRLWREFRLPRLQRVRFIACGTSANAAAVLAGILADAGIPSTSGPASESAGVVLEPGTITIALSQSGETADVLSALERTRALRSPLVALTNSPQSTLGRAADAVVDLGVGPEIGVAATKTFTAQVVAGTALLLAGLVDSGVLGASDAAQLVDHLQSLPDQLRWAHRQAMPAAAELAGSLVEHRGFLFIARGRAVPYAVEGALKLKEISYRFADAYAAGELKHGPIALVDTGTPVVVVDDGHPKLRSNIAEIEARGAAVIRVGGEDSTLPYRLGRATDLPWGPLPAIVALQHLAREIALALGRDVDKPRNLAKSVTVE
jgi:glucosamine--fructose-6-phosphate aminotransferase (isomerizing)